MNKKSSPRRGRFVAAFMMLWAGALAVVETSYFCWGQTTSATITAKQIDWRSGGRSHTAIQVLAVEFSFPLSNGQSRSGKADLGAGAQISEGDSLSIEYVPFYNGWTRPKDGNSRTVNLVLIGIITTTLGSQAFRMLMAIFLQVRSWCSPMRIGVED